MRRILFIIITGLLFSGIAYQQHLSNLAHDKAITDLHGAIKNLRNTLNALNEVKKNSERAVNINLPPINLTSPFAPPLPVEPFVKEYRIR